jgi:hypothetical protein
MAMLTAKIVPTQVQEPMFYLSQTDVHNMFQTLQDDMDRHMDVETDEESEAPTETGEEARNARKIKRENAKAAKTEKRAKVFANGKEKVCSKFGKA